MLGNNYVVNCVLDIVKLCEKSYWKNIFKIKFI